MSLKFYSTAVASLLVSGFCVAAHADCKNDYNWKYANGKQHKAFAMTAPGSALAPTYHGNAYSCSWSINQPDRKIAIQIAMAHCASIRARLDRRGACRIVQSQ